jgi:hypothetical protein
MTSCSMPASIAARSRSSRCRVRTAKYVWNPGSIQPYIQSAIDSGIQLSPMTFMPGDRKDLANGSKQIRCPDGFSDASARCAATVPAVTLGVLSCMASVAPDLLPDTTRDGILLLDSDDIAGTGEIATNPERLASQSIHNCEIEH